VAHGSADPRAAAAIGQLMPLVARRAAERGLNVPEPRVAYLGHAAPSVAQVMSTFGPDAHVTVLPLLLTAAYHSKTDIPRVLARTGLARSGLAGSGLAGAGRVTYGEPLGPHPLLLTALERRLPPAEDPSEVGVVLAAAGSSDPEANATIARLAAQWQARTGWFAVRPAYASAAAPDPATAVTQLREAGARRVVVATYLLAPGLFADRIREASLAAGAAAVSPALLPWPPAAAGDASPEVADVLLDRYVSAGTRQQVAA
jgi:sirohydrochlorin ferrochelatase